MSILQLKTEGSDAACSAKFICLRDNSKAGTAGVVRKRETYGVCDCLSSIILSRISNGSSDENSTKNEQKQLYRASQEETKGKEVENGRCG
jgi:hypothetical protein